MGIDFFDTLSNIDYSSFAISLLIPRFSSQMLTQQLTIHALSVMLP